MSDDISVKEFVSWKWILKISLVFVALVFVEILTSLYKIGLDSQELKRELLTKLDSVLLSAIAAFGVALFSVILLKYSEVEPEIFKIEKHKLMERHNRDYRKALYWKHDGIYARWVRNNLFRELFEKSHSDRTKFDIHLTLLEPNRINSDKCADLLSRIKRDRNIDEYKKFINQNILATIVASAIYNNIDSRFNISIYLNSDLNPLRYDMTNCGLFITLPNKNVGGYYVRPSCQYFKNIRTNFELQKDTLKSINLISTELPLIDCKLNKKFFSDILNKNDLSEYDNDNMFEIISSIWYDKSDRNEKFTI